MADETTLPVEGTNGAPALKEPTEQRPIGITSEQLKARLDETREGTRRELLKKFGFESEAALERRLKALKDIEEAQLSELEKHKKRVEELEPAAKRVEDLEKRYTKQLAKQVEALPENLQKILNERAETPEEMEALLEIFHETGAMGAQPSGQKPLTPPANTATSGKAPPAASAVSNSRLARWEQLKSEHPMRAASYYLTNFTEIQREKVSRG